MSVTAANNGPVVHPPDDMSKKSHGGMILTGETKVLAEKPVPVLVCPPKFPTWTDRGANTDLRGERPAINRLSSIYTLNYVP
jgi:hypothetical protein